MMTLSVGFSGTADTISADAWRMMLGKSKDGKRCAGMLRKSSTTASLEISIAVESKGKRYYTGPTTLSIYNQ